MDIQTTVVPLTCVEMVELYFTEWIMWQFDYKQHIIVNINTSEALHAITRKDKNNNYDWLSWHSAYVSQWDAWWNEIFT